MVKIIFMLTLPAFAMDGMTPELFFTEFPEYKARIEQLKSPPPVAPQAGQAPAAPDEITPANAFRGIAVQPADKIALLGLAQYSLGGLVTYLNLLQQNVANPRRGRSRIFESPEIMMSLALIDILKKILDNQGPDQILRAGSPLNQELQQSLPQLARQMQASRPAIFDPDPPPAEPPIIAQIALIGGGGGAPAPITPALMRDFLNVAHDEISQNIDIQPIIDRYQEAAPPVPPADDNQGQNGGQGGNNNQPEGDDNDLDPAVIKKKKCEDKLVKAFKKSVKDSLAGVAKLYAGKVFKRMMWLMYKRNQSFKSFTDENGEEVQKEVFYHKAITSHDQWLLPGEPGTGEDRPAVDILNHIADYYKGQNEAQASPAPNADPNAPPVFVPPKPFTGVDDDFDKFLLGFNREESGFAGFEQNRVNGVQAIADDKASIPGHEAELLKNIQIDNQSLLSKVVNEVIQFYAEWGNKPSETVVLEKLDKFIDENLFPKNESLKDTVEKKFAEEFGVYKQECADMFDNLFDNSRLDWDALTEGCPILGQYFPMQGHDPGASIFNQMNNVLEHLKKGDAGAKNMAATFADRPLDSLLDGTQSDADDGEGGPTLTEPEFIHGTCYVQIANSKGKITTPNKPFQKPKKTNKAAPNKAPSERPPAPDQEPEDSEDVPEDHEGSEEGVQSGEEENVENPVRPPAQERPGQNKAPQKDQAVWDVYDPNPHVRAPSGSDIEWNMVVVTEINGVTTTSTFEAKKCKGRLTCAYPGTYANGDHVKSISFTSTLNADGDNQDVQVCPVWTQK